MLKVIDIYKENNKIYGKFERKDKKTYTFILEEIGDKFLTDKIVLEGKKYAIESIISYGFKRRSQTSSSDIKEALTKISLKLNGNLLLKSV